MSEDDKATEKAPKEVVEATQKLAAAIKKNGLCILDMHTIAARRSTGNKECAEWERSCDELALAQADLSMAITHGGISQLLEVMNEESERSES